MSQKSIDELYKDLFNAQIEKNWGKVAIIQRAITRAESNEEFARAAREGEMEQNPPDVRDNERAIRGA